MTSKADFRASGLGRTRTSLWPPKMVWRTTGTSAEPYAFAVDIWYLHRHRAQRAFVYLQAGLRPGDRLLEIVRGNDRVDGPDRTYPTFRRSEIGYSRNDFASTVFEQKPRLLYANRSTLLEVADWIVTSGRSLSVDFVCSSTEQLYPQDEARLVDVFGARVLEVYGMAECANVAYRLPDTSMWTILEPRVVVEVLDSHGRPVGSGEVGEVVVTTLTESASPMLRYATGDLARVDVGPADGRSGLRLASLEGRTVDLLVDHAGNPVSFWAVVSSAFWASPAVATHIQRYQIHQRADRSIRISIELTPEGEFDAIEAIVHKHIRDRVGQMPVTVEVVERVHDPRAGKFRAITSDVTRRSGP